MACLTGEINTCRVRAWSSMLLEINGSNLSLFRSWITGYSEQFKVRGNSETITKAGTVCSWKRREPTKTIFLSAFKRSIFIGDEVDNGNFYSYYVLYETENCFEVPLSVSLFSKNFGIDIYDWSGTKYFSQNRSRMWKRYTGKSLVACSGSNSHQRKVEFDDVQQL